MKSRYRTLEHQGPCRPTTSAALPGHPCDPAAGLCSLLGLLMVLAGCGDPIGSEPCAQDAFGCRAGSELVVDPNCTNAEPLRVDVGQGRNEFETLDDGDALEVHYGSQGGQHVFVAARIENPDPDHEELELAFRLVLGRAADAGSTDDSDLFGGPSDSDDFVSSRKLVVQASNAPNQFDQAGLVLLVSTPWDATGEARLELKVRDSCGRSAEALHGVVVE